MSTPPILPPGNQVAPSEREDSPNLLRAEEEKETQAATARLFEQNANRTNNTPFELTIARGPQEDLETVERELARLDKEGRFDPLDHLRSITFQRFLALSQEQRESTLSQTFRLVSEEMENTDRYTILYTLCNLPPLERSATADQALRLDRACLGRINRRFILGSLVQIPFEERENVAAHVHRFVSQSALSTELKEKHLLNLLQIISSVSPDEREGIVTQTLRVSECIRSLKGCLAFLEEIVKIKPELRAEAVTQAMRLLDRTIIHADRYRNQHLVLKALQSIPPREWTEIVTQTLCLLDPSDIPFAMGSAMEILAAVPLNERESAIAQTLRLYNGRVSAYKYTILQRILHIPSDEREAASNQILRYVGNVQDESVRHSLIIQLLCLDDRNSIIDQAVRLACNHIDEPFRPVILGELVNIPADEREAVVSQTIRATTPETGLEDTSVILRDIHLIPASQRERAVTQALRLIDNQTSPEYKYRIVHRALSLPIQQIETVIAISLRFIDDQISPQERLRILESIIDMPPHFRETIPHPLQPVYLPYYPVQRGLNEILRFYLQDIAHEPLLILQMYAQSWTRAIPLIQYPGTEGVDAGGVTRDFITRLFHSLYPDDPLQGRLWLKPDSQNLAIPRTGPASSDREAFRYIGIIFGEILSGRLQATIGSRFSPLLFEILHSLTEEEIDNIQLYENVQMLPETLSKLIRIYAQSQLPYLTNEEIDEMTGGELPERMETDEIRTLEQFFTETGFYHVIEAAALIALGISSRVDLDEAKGETPAALMGAIQGSLSTERILNSFVWMNQNGDQQGFLTRWIAEAAPERLKQFLFCISGSETLGQQQLNIFSYNPANLQTVPSFHTCSFQMDLPRYGSYELFKDRLEYSLAHAAANPAPAASAEALQGNGAFQFQ